MGCQKLKLSQVDRNLEYSHLIDHQDNSFRP